MRIRSARANVFRKLRMPHRENSKNKAAVKFVRFARERVTQIVDAAVQFAQSVVVVCVIAQIVQRVQLLDAVLIFIKRAELLHKAVAAGKRARENDARFIAQCFGQQPAFGQVRTDTRFLVRLYQRNARFAQRIQTCRHRQLCCNVQCLDQFFRNAVLLRKVERTRTPREFYHLVGIVERFKTPAAVFGFHQTRHALCHHRITKTFGNQINKLFPAQNPHRIVGVHHRFFRARQTESRAADNNRAARRFVAVIGSGERRGLRTEFQCLSKQLRQIICIGIIRAV